MPGVCASRRVLCIANDTSGSRGIGSFVRIICSLQAWSSAKTHGIMFAPRKNELAPRWTTTFVGLTARNVHVHELVSSTPSLVERSNATNQTNPRRNPRRCSQFVSSSGQIDITRTKDRFPLRLKSTKESFSNVWMKFGDEFRWRTHFAVESVDQRRVVS